MSTIVECEEAPLSLTDIEDFVSDNDIAVISIGRYSMQGISQVEFNFQWTDNERETREDMANAAGAMLKAAGVLDIVTSSEMAAGGAAIHEMGTARMGCDPKDSLLNQYNQTDDVPNMFVSGGACMTLSACVNPSLTYMALTARAVDYAVKLLRAGLI